MDIGHDTVLQPVNGIVQQLNDELHIIHDADDTSYVASSIIAVEPASYSELASSKIIVDIKKVTEEIGSQNIDSEDFIEISHHFTKNQDNNIVVESKSIKFKDLCRAIAIQLVRNDLDVVKDEENDN